MEPHHCSCRQDNLFWEKYECNSERSRHEKMRDGLRGPNQKCPSCPSEHSKIENLTA